MLYLLVGLPFSGKSTWAKAQGVPIVNVDALRYAIHERRFDSKYEDLVWFHAKIMAEALFRAGHDDVILDATNTTHRGRNGWAYLFDVCHVMFMPPVEECIEKAIQCGRRDMVSNIQRMYDEFEMPTSNYFIAKDFNIKDFKNANAKIPKPNQSGPVLSGPSGVLHPVLSGDANTTRPAD